MLVHQINNEKIVVHCSTTQYKVLRISKIIQNKTILCIMLVDQMRKVCVSKKIELILLDSLLKEVSERMAVQGASVHRL